MTCKVCKWANHPPCPKNIPCCDCKEECNSRQCANEEPQTKVCTKCGRELPIEDFYQQNDVAGGRENECKHCYIERQQRRKFGEDYQVKHHTSLKGMTQEERKEHKREYMAQYREANREKMRENVRRCAQRKRHGDPDAPKLKTGPKKGTAIQHQDFERFPERHCDKCEFYPCFDGIENLESDFASWGCHGWKEK